MFHLWQLSVKSLFVNSSTGNRYNSKEGNSVRNFRIPIEICSCWSEQFYGKGILSCIHYLMNRKYWRPSSYCTDTLTDLSIRRYIFEDGVCHDFANSLFQSHFAMAGTTVCRNPIEIENGYVSHSNSFTADKFGTLGGWADEAIIDYKCFRHYALADSYQTKCTANGWVGHPDSTVYPRCEYSLATEGKFLRIP